MFHKNIDSSLYYIFHINPAVEWIITTLSFAVRSIVFFLDYFFNHEFFLACIFQLFFIKCANNFFTVEITNSICPRYSTLLLFWPHRLSQINLECSVPLQKYFYISVFSHDHQLWIRIFVIVLNTILKICTQLNIGRPHFDRSIIYFAILLNILSSLSVCTFFDTAVMYL